MIDAAGCGPPGVCPVCQHPAARVHSRYWRHMVGLPVNGLRLLVRLRVRRFFCDQPRCPRRTFVEQVAGLTEPRRRTSMAARSAMRSVAVELGGRPGATPLRKATVLWPADIHPEQADRSTCSSTGSTDPRHRRVRLPQGPDLRHRSR
ncbi:transposase family protein [Streptomyces erythrochromogenes]|uniref:transposase family protein n=1 Tax=Streptomyces erythrochromogenes TaxID=285574 RepID=UPI00368D53A0